MAFLTIVFTDVVQSSATKRDVSLGRDNRERDRAYLEKIQTRHFSLIRECCRAHSGHEISTMGDAFYLTFDDPVEAVRFAVEVQKRLGTEPIETPRGPLRLRIGIHSGFPESFEGGWHGTDVDTAARVEATATERQILLSSRTYELVRHMTDVKFHARGEFLLKGVDRTALWEADWDGNGPRPTATPPLSAGERKRMGLALGIAAVVLVAAGAAYYFYSTRKPQATESAPAHVATGGGGAPAPLVSAPQSPAQKPATSEPARAPSGAGTVTAPGAGSAQSAAQNPVVAGSAQAPARAAATPVIRYVPRSTAKLEQLVGDDDKERHQPTLSQTASRYQLQGADLGTSFEHEGHAYFLFGDAVGRQGRALDTIATTDASDPEAGVRLDFLTAGQGEYLTIQPPGISMGPAEIPVAGISLAGQIYVVVKTNHSEDAPTDRTVLTKFTAPATFQPLRTISQLPEGRFIKMSLHAEPGPIAGMPLGGPFVFVWGTGESRHGDAYLALVPSAQFETGKGTRYFAGLDAAGAPMWSEKEPDAKPVVVNGTIGNLSVTWCKDLSLWFMTYDRREPTPGIAFSYSRTPWGPWSEPQVLFNMTRDGALGKFIHDAHSNSDDGLEGPVFGLKHKANPAAVPGRAYAPYVVEQWTKVRGSEVDLYYVLSTWNPYVVVLMKSRLQVQ
ncbi:MAG: DUF4185 domain-containing protein [Acidobacteriia bacterium]|nr:DUF4185 domain-containing protein [Terriglobia bacterium]